MSIFRNFIDTVTGRFVRPTEAMLRPPGETVQIATRRGSYLTSGDRQRLSSALGISFRDRGVISPNMARDATPTPLERAVMDLLNKSR